MHPSNSTIRNLPLVPLFVESLGNHSPSTQVFDEPAFFDNAIDSTYFEFITCTRTSAPIIPGERVKTLLEEIRKAGIERVKNWKPLFPMEGEKE